MATEIKMDANSYRDALHTEKATVSPMIERAREAGYVHALPTTGKVLPLDRSQEISAERLDKAVNNLNDYVQAIRRELQFSVEEATGRTIITVVDSQTGEIIRQIPPEEVVALSRHLGSGSSAVLSTNT